MKALREALGNFDGKAVSMLSEIRAEFGGRKAFVAELVDLAADDDPAVSDGATWLIKNQLEEGVRLTATQMKTLLDRLDAITTWQAQLHLCQSVRYLDVPARRSGALADWLEHLLHGDRPFLRAWSMDALQRLAARNAELKKRASAALDAAERDPKASVRARARRWRKSPSN